MSKPRRKPEAEGLSGVNPALQASPVAPGIQTAPATPAIQAAQGVQEPPAALADQLACPGPSVPSKLSVPAATSVLPSQSVSSGRAGQPAPLAHPAESAGAAYVCSRCSLCGPGCCRMPLAHSEGRFPLSEADCARLQAYVTPDGKPGIEEAPNTAELQKNLQTLFPAAKRKIREQFPADGHHKRLALRPLSPAKNGFQSPGYGQCAFLGPLGCTVKIEDRPRYCRIFPFWASENTISCFMPEDCLAVKEAATLGQLLRLLQMTEKDVLKLFDALQSEWKLKD